MKETHMKRIAKISLLLTVVLASITGCKEIYGTLFVNEKIKLKGNKERQTFSPGEYDVTIDVGRKRIALKFERDNSDNSKYRFYYPDDFDMPEDGDIALISHRDSGQKYDLSITKSTEVRFSDLRRGWENCSYTRSVRTCGYHNGRYRCWWQDQTVYGQRQVEYVIKTEDVLYSANLSDPDSDDSVANFQGNDVDTSRQYEYFGPCR